MVRKPPLIAIHNTGVYYYNLSRRLGPDQPLTALQLFDPSIARQSLPPTLEDIAAEYVQLIHKFQATGPYKLIGWCVGGVLAFEVARQLVEAGHEVSLLAMIDAWAPGHHRRLSQDARDPRRLLVSLAADWRGLAESDVARAESGCVPGTASHVQKTAALVWPLAGRCAEARVAFETRESSAENYDQWLLGYLEETAQGYEPKLYSGKITLLCSAREPKGLFLDPRMGWGAFALGGVDVSVLDGDHFTVFKGQGLEQMAAQVSAVMDVYDNRGNDTP